MVRQCQVCGKVGSFYPELSFHRFPTDSERRKLWFSIVGFGFCSNKVLPKHPEICSAHFDPTDIVTKENGLRYILPGANPQLCDPFFSQSEQSSSAYSSDSTVYEIPPRKSGKQKIRSSSWASATAFEAEIELANLQNIMQIEAEPKTTPTNAQKTVKRKRRVRYIGDMESSDFSSPKERRRNLARLKQVARKQRKRIHSLQTTVRRLRLRITSLKSLLSNL